MIADQPTGLLDLRAALCTMADGVPLAAGVEAAERRIADVRCLIVTASGTPSGTIFYVHGGAFCLLAADPYVPMAGHLAAATGCRVVIADYGLPPEHPFPTPLLQVAAVHARVADQARDASLGWPGPLVLAGDSAGANLALSAVTLGDALGVGRPDLIALFSPWLDLTLSTRSARDPATSDTQLDPRILADCARAYADGVSLSHPLVSPRVPASGPLPPLFVWAGSDERLLDDARDIVAAAVSAGGRAELEVAPGAQHNFPFWGPLEPAAMHAFASLGRHIGALRVGN